MNTEEFEAIEHNVKAYHHLMCRVEYPRERGYRMESSPLPDGIYLSITEDKEKDNKHLTVHSRIHMDKAVKVGPDYSCAFSDRDIIQDLSGEISRRFLN